MTQTLYPYLHIGTLFIAMTILTYISISSDPINHGVAVIVFFASAIRVVVFLHPESLISLDPDLYAYWASILVENGFVETMGLDFYEGAPLFLINISVTSIITSMSTVDSMVLYPLAAGLIFPLTTGTIVKSIRRQPSAQLVLLSMTLAAFSTTMMTFSYRPKAQLHATFIWCAMFILILYTLQSDQDESKLITAIVLTLLFSLVISHKLPPIVVTLVLSVFLGYITLSSRWIQFLSGRFKAHLVAISGILVVVQMVYISDYLSMVIFRIQRLLMGISGEGSIQDPSEAIYAIPGTVPPLLPLPQSSMTVLVVERSYIFVLLLLSGVAWLKLFKEKYDKLGPVMVLSVTTVTVALTLIGVGGISGINPSRPLLLSEMFLVGMVAWAFSPWERDGRIWRVVLWGILGVFLISQIFSPAALPEYDNNPRYYLDKPEVDGKLFGCHYIPDTIHTDTYYAQERYLYPEYCDSYRSLDRGNPPPLYDGSVIDQDHSYIAHRTGIEVYVGQHTRRILTWDPELEYDQEYNRIYDNDAVLKYANT
ncbi:hypothetical protein [Natrialba chahannaoensis]|uniref:hypothetical protein n=1 Tax=Natrialba chahannaoensis TaxID=68911 RepID=UPI0012695EA7|nr:hypothetical protein [Natrialba chahannaoensis]